MYYKEHVKIGMRCMLDGRAFLENYYKDTNDNFILPYEKYHDDIILHFFKGKPDCYK